MKHLKWSPYVGDNFSTAKSKLLLIGESHYLDEKPDSLNRSKDPQFTKEVVKSLGVNEDYYPSHFFPNVNRLFALNDTSREAFWSKVAFYNFIQRPMFTKNTRPNRADIALGWSAFDEILEKLSPDICLFLGNSNAKTMQKGLSENQKLKVEPLRYMNKVGGSWFYKSNIERDDKTITCLFIKHPSRYFSYIKWRKELSNKYDIIFHI
ncbi:hypothetical protein AWW68_11540 [Roseivirga spongicola]|uniref:Uncharacterized protein n=1 Tax=Roseivirga spongicola TaxID=333140 RepID=A0A150X3P8_9BACT|nr:uracil-DNA glycosylase family protein [Roseivirga spongicola]KYG73333.1 hypothetical protein AWW68_11540 [Roseivirga spongicola]